MNQHQSKESGRDQQLNETLIREDSRVDSSVGESDDTLGVDLRSDLNFLPPDCPSGATDETIASPALIQLRRSESDPLPLVPGYEILGILGQGGMGIVYRAREIRLDRSCALKAIRAGAHAGDRERARFFAEAQAVARVHHPNVVQIYHITEIDGFPVIEFEYIDGGSLEQRLNGSPWSPVQAARFIEGVANGVAEAHRQGLVHRDLKPANILIDTEGNPKVTDFGLAKVFGSDDGLTRTNALIGTPAYMAPEQAAGKAKELGPEGDVHSLGVILYEVLTGRQPFVGDSMFATLEQVRNAEVNRPSRFVPGIPHDLETILLKCLEKDPGQRYPTASELAEDLRRFLENRTIEARRPSSSIRLKRWLGRNRLVVGLSMALGAAIAVAAFSLMKLSSKEATDGSVVVAAESGSSKPPGSVAVPTEAGYRLRLIIVGGPDEIRPENPPEVIIADARGVLHFQVIDRWGKLARGSDENQFPVDDSEIAALRRLLEPHWPEQEFQPGEGPQSQVLDPELKNEERSEILRLVRQLIERAPKLGPFSKDRRRVKPPRPRDRLGRPGPPLDGPLGPGPNQDNDRDRPRGPRGQLRGPGAFRDVPLGGALIVVTID